MSLITKTASQFPTRELVLKSMNADPPGLTELRIQNLAVHFSTLQVQPPLPQK